MTTDEVRDELARMDGWTLEEGEHHEWCPDDRSITTYPAVWIKGDDWITCHPHPPTLDGANAAVPEGWTWSRTRYSWFGEHDDRVEMIQIPDTGNPMDDLYALALACRRAMEERK